MTITPYSLDEVFHPRSVAILGASRAPQKWGHVVAKQLINGGFPVVIMARSTWEGTACK